MDWTTYTERRKRRDRWIIATLGAAVMVALGVLVACTVALARVS